MNNILWKPDPSRVKESKMALFMEFVNRKYNLSIDKYLDLHNWSISSPDLFWGSVSDFFKIKYSFRKTTHKNILRYLLKLAIFLTRMIDCLTLRRNLTISHASNMS